jgi:E3 ubiquitin-protein ligase HERC2
MGGCLRKICRIALMQLSTSVGGDGHSLALAASGEVFSWGDGEDGKLGHGTADRWDCDEYFTK